MPEKANGPSGCVQISPRDVMALPAFLEEVALDKLRVVDAQPNPDRWSSFCGRYHLSWTYTPFKRGHAKNIADRPGLYCFHIGHGLRCLPAWGLSLYGGSTKRSLRARCRKYFQEQHAAWGRRHVRFFLTVFEGDLTFAWAEVDPTTLDLYSLEKEFNDAMMPHYSVKDFSADVRAGKNLW